MSAVALRLAVPAEQHALEELQRRGSLMWEEDRDALPANPDAMELPFEQTCDSRPLVGESAGQFLGFAVVLPRDDGSQWRDARTLSPERVQRGRRTARLHAGPVRQAFFRAVRRPNGREVISCVGPRKLPGREVGKWSPQIRGPFQATIVVDDHDAVA